MSTDYYNKIIELFKDATKQLDELTASEKLEKLKADLHAYSTEVAMFFVREIKEGESIVPISYDEVLKKVQSIVNKAKTGLA